MNTGNSNPVGVASLLLAILVLIAAAAHAILPGLLDLADRAFYYRIGAYLLIGVGVLAFLLGRAARDSASGRIGMTLSAVAVLLGFAYVVLTFATVVPGLGPVGATPS